MKKAILGLSIAIVLSLGMSGSALAQCYGSLMLSSNYFEFDYLVRIAVHFGDAASIPDDIVCTRSMLPGELTIDVPIWAYNLNEGAQYFEFSIVSNESLTVFVPDNCLTIVGSCRCACSGYYRLDLALQACSAQCGPLRLGYAEITRVHGGDPVWIDLRPNSQTGKMFAMDSYGKSHSMFSPQHGGFVGQNYLYACQEPICEEPNSPVTGLAAAMGQGCYVRLSWNAGSGNRTLIRYRTDRYPTGIDDGTLVVEVPSTPGESQQFVHTGIPTTNTTLYYKVFSLTRDAGDNIVRSSFVECGAVASANVNCEIATQSATWGTIKSLFK
jgi:hypothetical protein